MIAKIKKLFKENFTLVLLVLIPILAGNYLLKPGYFSMHDDIQVMRLYEMEKCFKDGQIPCRWVPDMGAGFGHPLFNYHPVFPYYAGMILRLFNLSFVDISKLLFLFSLIFSSLFMYLLAKEFFGKAGGLLSASMYVLAPYHAVDIFVRGALTESWALAFFPLVLWSLYKFITANQFLYFLSSIISIFLLLISHNTMPLIFFPVALFWALLWIVAAKNWKAIPRLCLIVLWSVGLSAFFLIPSLLEINLAKLETMASGYYDYKNHFVTIFQLFLKRGWGYGPSIAGSDDTMPFQLGWPMWPISLLVGFMVLSGLAKNKVLAFAFVIFGFSVFMTHAKSYWLWNLLPGMNFVQFPWRFLSLSILSMALLAGGLVQIFKAEKMKISLAFLIIFISFLLNFNYFKPEYYFSDRTDAVMLSGSEWKTQSMATLNDYVPVSVNKYPQEMAPDTPWVVEGKAKITEFKKRSNYWRFAVETVENKAVWVEIPVFDFPIWEVYLNTEKAPHLYDPETGVVQILVPAGNHTVVTGWLRDTLIRKIANWLSMFSLFVLMVLIIKKGKNQRI